MVANKKYQNAGTRVPGIPSWLTRKHFKNDDLINKQRLAETNLALISRTSHFYVKENLTIDSQARIPHSGLTTSLSMGHC